MPTYTLINDHNDGSDYDAEPPRNRNFPNETNRERELGSE